VPTRGNTEHTGRLVDLSGGMVDVVHPALLNDSESKLLKNVSLEEKGTLKPCKGRTRRFASPFDASNPCNGIYAFYPDTATSRLVMGAGTKLFKDTPHLIYRWTDQADFDETGSSKTPTCDTTTTPGDIKVKAAPTLTFTRSSVAYKSDGTQVAANVPRFEPGKFSQAIMVGEGTTNLLGKTIGELPAWGNRYGLYDESSVVDETRQVDETLLFDEATQYLGEMLFNTVLGVIHLI